MKVFLHLQQSIHKQMNSTHIFNSIGEFCQDAFQLMPMIANKFNYTMIVVAFIALFIWLKMQADYTKKAEQDGTLK